MTRKAGQRRRFRLVIRKSRGGEKRGGAHATPPQGGIRLACYALSRYLEWIGLGGDRQSPASHSDLTSRDPSKRSRYTRTGKWDKKLQALALSLVCHRRARGPLRARSAAGCPGWSTPPTTRSPAGSPSPTSSPGLGAIGSGCRSRAEGGS